MFWEIAHLSCSFRLYVKGHTFEFEMDNTENLMEIFSFSDTTIWNVERSRYQTIALVIFHQTITIFSILATLLIGNDRFEGFGVDIIHELSEILGFKYEFRLEKQYGNKDPITKEWNGMIRQLQDDVRRTLVRN